MLLYDKLTEEFYQWELRGRGWQVFPLPVALEPPFRPFRRNVKNAPLPDDGHKPTILSSWMQKLSQSLLGDATIASSPVEDHVEPEPIGFTREGLVELALTVPTQYPTPRETFEHFLSSLSLCGDPLSYEWIATDKEIIPQFAVHPLDARILEQQFSAYFPEVTLSRQEGRLEGLWDFSQELAIAEFGLAHEFMLPLHRDKMDLFVALSSALSELETGEVALFQIMFQPVHHPWPNSIERSVSTNRGEAFFVDHPGLLAGAKDKLSSPLYAVVIRLAATSGGLYRAWEIVRNMAGALTGLAKVGGNELIPLHNEGYPFLDHEEDVFRRQSRRSGMLLNRDELLNLVHLPSPAVATPKLVREKGNSKAAPIEVRGGGILLGHNLHAGKTVEVRLSFEQRVRHIHLIGASGTGKSTLLLNLIKQDIENGEGLAVLDPHGDLIEQILGIIPPERINDVVLLDPSDEEYSIGFNILSAHSELEKTLLASDLSSVFKRLSTSWGDQMHSVLNNAILAFLESSEGGTLADLRRFLLETKYREKFLSTVTDPEVVYYWRKSFPQLGGNKSIGPLMTRLETFLGPKPIRHMVSQKTNRLNYGEIMDTGKIFLAKLPQGQIGKENSYLLGSLLMSKFQQQAMSRQSVAKSSRRPFWLYCDEFHQFITPSVVEILTGARKYNLGLILAHQELRQLQQDSDVAGAVLSNAGTRVVFRVGDNDARTLAEGFFAFPADSLRQLGVGEAICRVERSDHDFNLTVPLLKDIRDPGEEEMIRAQIIASSRSKYATPREEVQAELMRQFEVPDEPVAKSAISKIPPAPKPPVEKAPESSAPTVPAEAPPVVPDVPAPSAPARETKPAPKKTSPPADMGRGGAQHQSIQKRLKTAAEQLGFLASIEKQIPGGSIDLALEKGIFPIACEITITTTIDHEFGNVQKCLKAGFPLVAVISPKPERLLEMEVAIKAGMGSEEAKRVCYFTPDQFIAWLRDLPPPAAPPSSDSPPSAPADSTKRGYKVRRRIAKLSDEERQSKEDVAIKAIAQSMKNKSQPK